jgi:peptidyl-prolyl cis-trans isomerase C
MRTVRFALLALSLSLIWGCGGQRAEDEMGGAEDLARVGDHLITSEEFEKELATLPPFQRREMETPQGKQKFLDRLVEMELLYLAAMDAGLADDEDLVMEIARARRQILMRHYYKENIETKAQPSEEEIEVYYGENLAEFSVKERIRGRLILSATREDSRKLETRLAAGESFPALAASESIDKPTAAEDGDMGWFTADGYVRSIGVKPDFTAKLFELNLGEISDPIEVADKGWAIVRIDEREPAGSKELSEVRDDIVRRLTPTVREKFYKDSMEALRVKYKVEMLGEPFISATTPEELFEMAQSAEDPLQRIEYYQQVVDRFGDFEQADRAQFMVGFVYSEELSDKESARKAFDAFLEKFPDSDLAKDARYMIDVMEGKEPPFQID